jgi:exodeoxyribonuclease VII small subunit
MSDASTHTSPKFEDALKRLEEIVHALEDGNVGLNESLERYEEGVKLLRQSYELLERAERKIELLSGVDADGNPVTRSFDATATLEKNAAAHDATNGDADETAKRRSRKRSAPTKKQEDNGGLFGENDDMEV